MIYFCAQKNRRALVLQSATLNGIDYLEVVGDNGCGRQLAVTMLKDARTLTLNAGNIAISGGAPVAAVSITSADDDDPFTIRVNLDASGDFSVYQFALVAAPGITDPPDGFDPQLSSLSFSFRAGCPTPADCLSETCCPVTTQPPPDINYMAKDYPAFRQVMLDRFSALIPSWTETHAADMGMALVETLAYAADHLSYQQDSVSTEAYIGTARSRISLRRHARLVNYTIGEGCNARVWVALTTAVDGIEAPAGTQFYVRQPDVPAAIRQSDPELLQLTNSGQPVFEAMQPATLHLEQNSMDFYTWGDGNCCLPAGATEATLVKHLCTLRPGQVLIFEEVLGPDSGEPADANPAQRCAVQLVSVSTTDYQQRPLVDPLTGQAITRIAWSADDALPFPMCISSTADAEHESTPVNGVSVARGNIVLADQGTWIEGEDLPAVPPAPPAPPAGTGCNCQDAASARAPIPRYHPQLGSAPLTFSPPFTGLTSASDFLTPDASQAVPQIWLTSSDGDAWSPLPDLLSSDDTDRVFVAEIERDGSAFLRFGDGQYGQAPEAGLAFAASYRVGNGSSGNIGRDSLGHVVLPPAFTSPPGTISAVRNPLDAGGGIDPEDMGHITQYAPFSYQTQVRCVTEADYGDAAAQIAGVREARGTLRWTGSWYTAFVSVDPVSTLTPQLIRDTTSGLNLRRMMGTDLAVEAAKIVGLQIELEICVDPNHFQGDVYTALMKLFITGDQCNGQSGLLNAANFTFGEIIFLSPFIAGAQQVEGVLAVTATTFTRMDAPWVDGIAQGYLTMGRLEIARCDNDPNHLDHGSLVLHMDGGK